MAIAVARASSQFAEATTSPVSAMPFTMAAWYRPSSIANGTAFGVSNESSSTSYFALGMNASGVSFLEVSGGTSTQDSTAGTLTNGAWSHLCGVATSATSRTCYKDGAAGTPNTTNVGTITGLNRVTAGCLTTTSARVSFAGGDIAEAAIWNVALDAAEVAALAKGFSPLLIRPASLVFYSPLLLAVTPEQELRNSLALTFGATTAAPTKATSHPQVFKPGTRVLTKHTATGGGGTDLTVTPGTPNVDWAGSTPALKLDRVLVPGTPSVAWTGSTPTLTITGDLTLTPGAAVTAWTGSTPGVLVDKALSPGTPNVAWSGSTPDVLLGKTLTPGTAVVAWQGSTPALTLQGDLTLTPGAAVVTWTGSTPTVRIVPDVVPEPPAQGGSAGFSDDEDFSTVDVRNLTLRPGVARVRWSGSAAFVRVEIDPVRFRLPRRRERPVVPVPVVDLTLAPRAASVAYSGSRAVVRATSLVSMEELQAELAQRDEKLAGLEKRLAEMQREHEEEFAVLTALSAG